MGKITVTEARPEHYNDIIELITKYLDSEGSMERNRNLFAHQWRSMPAFDEVTSGNVLLNEDDDVVGYVGYIMSKRTIAEQEVIVNSGSTLVMKPEYSMYMIKLLEPYMRKDVVRVAYNPRSNVEKLYTNRFFGLTQFMEYTRIFPAIGINLKGNISISDNIEDAYLIASLQEKNLISDNCKYMGETITINTPKGSFNIIGRRFRLRAEGMININISFFEVLYVGDKELFGKYLKQIIQLSCKRKKAPFFICDDRFLTNKGLPINIKKKFKCFYAQPKGINIEPHDMDDLYSEKILLNFYEPPKPVKITLKRILKKQDFLEIDNEK